MWGFLSCLRLSYNSQSSFFTPWLQYLPHHSMIYLSIYIPVSLDCECLHVRNLILFIVLGPAQAEPNIWEILKNYLFG